jgi:ribonuclease P protein component
MSGLATLKTRADFLRVAATRARAVTPGFVLQAGPRPAKPDGDERIRVGFTASRKVGNAVIRNRAKRRLRTAAAEVLPRLGRPGTDYVLVARAEMGERPYSALIADLEVALRRLANEGRRGAKPGAGRPPGRRGDMDREAPWTEPSPC